MGALREPSGPDASDAVFTGYEVYGLQGVGDVDGDGLGDLLLAVTLDYSVDPFELYLVYGDAARGGLPDHRKVDQPPEWSDIGHGARVHRLGDLDGDGRAEFAASAFYADYDGATSGKLSVYSPVCTWYADQDGDGHGDPSITTETCHDPGEGWAMRGDDCDDGDPTVFGDTWYLDGDGDGYGTRDGETLACTQPAGSSTSWQDCDDDDPGIRPDAADLEADGIDQDCDGCDGPWNHDNGACAGPPPDTGEPATPEDSGETTDSAAPADSGTDSPVLEDTASDSPDAHPRAASAPDCGCGGAAGVSLGGVSALLALLLARRRNGAR